MHSPSKFQFFLLNPGKFLRENDFGGHPSHPGEPYALVIYNLKINPVGTLVLRGHPFSIGKKLQTLKEIKVNRDVEIRSSVYPQNLLWIN